MDHNHQITVVGPVDDGDTGTRLVAALADSDKLIVIAFAPHGYNHARAQVWRNAVNGQGTHAYVYFDPRVDRPMPTRLADGRVVNQAGRPAYIGLGHELIHALHMVRGTLIGKIDARGEFVMLKGRHRFKDRRGKIVTANEDLEELATIGIGQHGSGPTENDLRREHHVQRRGAHSLRNVEAP